MPRLALVASLVLLPASVACAGAAAPCTCLGDLNGDHVVDAADLAIMLGAWGGPQYSIADLDNNHTVDAADLALLLGTWGPCTAPPNDHCGNAILIGNGATPFCT